MELQITCAVMLPFLGTVLGSAGVFFLRGAMNRTLERTLTGFAAGVMVAASVWSLIIPAMDQSAHLGRLAFLPAFIGVWAGFGFLLLLDQLIPHLHLNASSPEGVECGLGKSTMMVLAVALHNLPEGMAVGVVVAGWLSGSETISFASALALSVGIALQNLPEGAIISMPLKSSGMSRRRAFGYGVASGVIEPIGAVLTILLANFLVPTLPYMLSFAVGFTLMMMLDVALG